MQIAIDHAGRIVVPKSVRDRLGFRPDTRLELEENVNSITLHPVRREPALVRDRGFWVYTGKPARKIDWDRLVEDDREDRIQQQLKDSFGL